MVQSGVWCFLTCRIVDDIGIEILYLEYNSSIRTENTLSKRIIEHSIIEQKQIEQNRTELNNWEINILKYTDKQ